MSNQSSQPALLAEANAIVSDFCAKHNLPIRFPRQRLVVLVLTHNAFLGLPNEQAAEILGVSVNTVKSQLADLRRDFPSMEGFDDAWNTPIVMRNVDKIDQKEIVRVF